MIRNLLYLRYWTNFFLSISDVENHGLMKTFQVVDLCEPKVLSVTLLLLWIENGVEEKQYECNCCVMNGPRSFTASTATPPASSAATDLFRHTRLVDQSSSSGTAGINTDYTTEVDTTQIHFWTYFNVSSLMKIQLFSSIFHLNLLKFFWSWGFWKILLGWYDLVLNEFLYFKARGWALEFLRPYFSLLHFRVCFILS